MIQSAKLSPPDPRPALWTGLGTLLLLLLLFRWTDWDQRVAAYYWQQGQGSWPEARHPFALLLYRFGTWPALLAGASGGAAFLLSYSNEKLRRWRGPGLFLFLLLLLGPGLLVNTLGKNLAGRPRPSDVLGFGGAWAFQPLGSLGFPGRGQSFPSGHASMGFYWLGLFFLWRRRWLGLGLGLLAGAALSWARVLQGGHYLSDTLAAGALVFCVAALLSPLIHWQPQPSFWGRRELQRMLLLGALAFLSVSQVRYEERDWLWSREQEARAAFPTQRVQAWQGAGALNKVAVDLALERGDLELRFDALPEGALLPLRLEERFLGQGFPGARAGMQVGELRPSALFAPVPGTLGAQVSQQLRGAWWNTQGRYILRAPGAKALDLRLKTARGVLTIASLPAGRQVLLLGRLRKEMLPADFHPYDQSAWLRDGAQPQIALSLDAPDIRFLP